MIRELGEFGLIDRLVAGLPTNGAVVLGPGDDAAALALTPGRLLLATVDAQVEGIHFRLADTTPQTLGRRVAAVNLSDIAAMGGAPTFALVSLLVPEELPLTVLDGLYAGLREELSAAGAVVVGGNVARLPGRLAVDLTLLGEVEPARMLTRGRAKPGELVVVSGELGLAAAGLRLLLDPGLTVAQALREEAVARHLGPTARLELGRRLGASGRCGACIDLSDGLAGDLAHLATQSRVAIEIEAAAVPIGAATRAVAEASGIPALELALHGGEDYELAFTWPDGARHELTALSEELGLPLTVVGRVTAGPPAVRVVDLHGHVEPLTRGAFRHF